MVTKVVHSYLNKLCFSMYDLLLPLGIKELKIHSYSEFFQDVLRTSCERLIYVLCPESLWWRPPVEMMVVHNIFRTIIFVNNSWRLCVMFHKNFFYSHMNIARHKACTLRKHFSVIVLFTLISVFYYKK